MDVVNEVSYLRKTLNKLVLSTIVLGLGLFSSAVAQVSLPKYTNYTAPSPSPSAPGEAFNPTMSGAPKAGTPVCAEWTRSAGPDESMILTGSAFSAYSGTDQGKDSRFTIYSSNGRLTDANIQRLENDKAAITLNAALPRWSMYLIWPGNDTGYGLPIAVNKTDAWWIGPAKANRGHTVSVFGRNLSQYNDSTTSNVYIKAVNGTGQWATVTKVNPYKVDFVVPSNLANGDYEVWTHNGHGGDYGWSGPLKLTITNVFEWNNTTFNVKDYGATGNGVTDDAQAIRSAINAAKQQPGSTVYFPQGTYMIGYMLQPSDNNRWLGDGPGKSIIKCNSNFASSGSDAMVFGYPSNFEANNLTFDTNNKYQGIHAEPFMIRGSSDVRLNNLEFSFQGYNILQLDNANRVSINNCKLIGKISFLGKCSQLFIDKCEFDLTNDTELALHSWGGAGISITNSVCKDYNNSDPNNGAGWGKGRFFVATGNSGSTRNTYLGNNTTQDLAVRASSDVDQNSGEQFLWEGFSSEWAGTISAASATTLSLSGYSPATDKVKYAVVIKGKGLGQSRRITAVNGSTITLEEPLNLLPNEQSTIAIGHYAEKIVLYKNYIDGKEYAVTSPDPNASAGIEPYGGIFNFIADGNTVHELRAGLANWSTQHSAGVDPNYFSLYTNNKVIACRFGIQNGLYMSRPTETALFGSVFRGNTISNTLQSAVVNTISSTSNTVLENFIYEHNEFSNTKNGYSTGGDYGLPFGYPSDGQGIESQMLYKNKFVSGLAGSDIFGIKITPKIAIRDNTYDGYGTAYLGALPDVIEAPLHVIEMTATTGGSVSTSPFTLWNSGTAALAWSSNSSTPWLSISDTTGTIQSERGNSVITLKANPVSLAAGKYTSNIIVKSGVQQKKYTVILNVAASSAPITSITAPVSNTSFVAPASVTITASASDADGSISKVEFFAGAVKLGEDLTSPYSFDWNNAAAGTYSLTTVATDNAGLSTTSAPVSITVNAPFAPVVSLTSPATNTTLTAPASITITSAASDQDGTISKVEFFAGNVKLGEDLTSPYSFSWSNITAGSYAITAKAIDNSGLTAISAPVTITVNAAPVAPVVALNSPAANISLTAPAFTTITAAATDQDGTVSKVEFFAGTVKLGEDLTSPYSFDWSNIVAGIYSITAKATDNSGLSTTSAAVVLTVAAPAIAPQVAITAPLANASFTAPASININIIASDEDGSITKVEFFSGNTKLGEDLVSPFSFSWNTVSAGTYSITAKATDNSGLTSTSLPVNILVSTPFAPLVTLTSPVANTSYSSPASITLTASASDTDGSITKVEFFSGTTKLAEDLSMPYSFNWDNIPAGAYTVTAKATDNSGLVTTSAGVNITVNAPVAPSVALLPQPSNTLFTAPASTTLTATASDADGTIYKVEFFAGSTKLGEDFSSPYSFDWSNIAAGTYSITAKATDNSGLTSTSVPVTITVNAPLLAPQISITSPAVNTTLTEPASVTLAASANDSDGSVIKVEFFADNVKLGEDFSSPYTFTWGNIASGIYSITARATDNSGLATTSVPVNLTVKASVAPMVSLTSPAVNTTFTAPASVNITAAASDQDGTISKVEFFSGSTKLGEDLTSPYSFDWTSIAAGAYSITAKATDNSGLSTTSNAVNITVNAPLLAPLVSITSPVDNTTFTSPASVSITASASGQDGTISKVEFFSGSAKLGEDLTSPYAFTWSNVPAGTYSITAKATDNSGLSTISAAIAIAVVTPPVSNIAPQVSITSPATGIQLTAPASTTFNAAASDQDGNIAKVEFFAGGTKLGEDLTSPYAFTWNNIPAGTYSITAKATDNAGLSTSSAAVNVVVNAPVSNIAPQVAVTSPVTNANFTTPASATIVAAATDEDGSIVKVEFFAGGNKLGEDLASPYSFDWNNIPAGTYSITAKATDNSGLSTTSAAITISVSAAVVVSAPQVTVTSPVSNSTLTALATTTITATASDISGTITKVEFFASGVKLGEDLSSPYSIAWNNISAGTYAITARATSSTGISSTSSPVEIVVGNPVINVSTSVNAYPNPFQQYVTIDFKSDEKTTATLQIFTFQGLLLQTLYKGKVEPGTVYTCKFDGSRYPNGTYISKLVCGKNVLTKLLLLSKYLND